MSSLSCYYDTTIILPKKDGYFIGTFRFNNSRNSATCSPAKARFGIVT